MAPQFRQDGERRQLEAPRKVDAGGALGHHRAP
jgi:hypothetical protein